MNPQSNFFLAKWYLDCVSDRGDAVVGYAASLRWRGFRQGYSSVLYQGCDRQGESRTSLRYAAPELQDGRIRWSAAKLAVDGTWSSLAPPIERVLSSPSHPVQWSCLMPSADADVALGTDRQLRGLGYVERLTLAVPPWQLALDELRWGRFLSPRDAIVWIDWRGTEPQRLVFHNGERQPQAWISDHELAFGSAVLTLNDSRVLRAGPLLDTALAAVPGLDRVVPLRILQTHEQKWLSRGCLKDSAGESSGWAIHEVVRFKPPQEDAL